MIVLKYVDELIVRKYWFGILWIKPLNNSVLGFEEK